MAIRVTLECGHSSVLRSRTTPEGYTHDWEVFVRGVNNADIHIFVEKVVFHLHETFPKPKRTVKSPPYILKESGYAGFVIPIHIYLKNRDEPKKFIVSYDLQLQPSGPAINNVIEHTEVVVNPSDEFRKLLIKGGAVAMIKSEESSDKFENKMALPMTGKPKLSGTETKKHRPAESKPVTTFADLFGTPIKTGKISPDSNKKVSSEKSTVNKTTVSDKNDKMDRSQKTKHSQHKDVVKDKINDDRKDKKDKDKDSFKDKDKDKNKDKYKRTISPTNKNQLSPKVKRTVSPSPLRKPSSPPPTSTKRSSSPKQREKDSKKVDSEKDRDKDKTSKDASRASLEDPKSDRKKDKKRHKEDKEKEKKDKHKEKERDRSKESSKSSDSKKSLDKSAEKQEKVKSEKIAEAKASVKEEKKSPKAMKEYDKSKEEKLQQKADKSEKVDKTEKRETKSNDKEKQQRHKHKKKDKKEKRDTSKDRERKEKRDKSKSLSEKSNNSASNPLSTLMAEIPANDSDSRSAEEDSFVEAKPTYVAPKKDEEQAQTESARTSVDDFAANVDFVKKDKSERHKRDKTSKLSRNEERENRKKKRKSDSKLEEETERELKREKARENSTSPGLEPVSSSQSPVATETERLKDAYKEHVAQKPLSEREQEQVTPDSTNSALVDTDNFESLGFSEEYVSQLKDLQHKIMTIQDNQELQRVVQVIAETGQYEITKKTFDFDLCALDRRTVQRLQKFFSGS